MYSGRRSLLGNRFKAGQSLVLGYGNRSIKVNKLSNTVRRAGPVTLTGSRVTSAGSVLAFHYRNRSAVKSMRHSVTNTCLWRPSLQTLSDVMEP